MELGQPIYRKKLDESDMETHGPIGAWDLWIKPDSHNSNPAARALHKTLESIHFPPPHPLLRRPSSTSHQLRAMDGVFWSNLVGYISITCWFVVYTPQLYENYKRKSGDGLSMTFLIIWLAGDVFNVLGVVYQDLLFTMLLLGVYYTFADIGLIYQVIYYRHYPAITEIVVDTATPTTTPFKETTPLLSSTPPSISYSSSSSSSSAPCTTALPMHRHRLLKALALALFASLAGIALFWGLRPFPDTSAPCNPDDTIASPLGVGSVLPPPPSSDRDIQVIPQIFGWISALLYVGSRVPQIVKNYRNKSTEGLSLAMFGFSVLGNSTFCLSIFLRSIQPHFLLINLPWLCGSGGTLIFDFTIFAQFYVYRGHHHAYVHVTDPEADEVLGQ